MEAEEYNNIVKLIKNYRGLSKDCMKRLVTEFPHCSYNTLFSILMFEYQRRMKQNHIKMHSSKQEIWDTYQESVKTHQKPGKIVRIARSYDVAPCLVAKIILNRYFEEKHTEDDEQPDKNINVYLRDTARIPNGTLAYEVYLCTLYDNIYSPGTDIMKSSLGQEYELKLYREATELGLAFRDEEQLRQQGYDKTPDCKLEVPIAMNGFIINWIESKALFGEAEVHNDYVKNQYMGYWNRFGPGLVIYWFGFLETIVDPSEKRYIIRDHLPKDFVQLPPPRFDFDF